MFTQEDTAVKFSIYITVPHIYRTHHIHQDLQLMMWLSSIALLYVVLICRFVTLCALRKDLIAISAILCCCHTLNNIRPTTGLSINSLKIFIFKYSTRTLYIMHIHFRICDAMVQWRCVKEKNNKQKSRVRSV